MFWFGWSLCCIWKSQRIVYVSICCIIIFINIILLLSEFFSPALADGLSLYFEWQQVTSSLQDSSQYSGRFLNDVVLRMVFSRPPKFKSSSSLNKPLGVVLNTPIRIGITVSLMFHGKVTVLVLLFAFFHFLSVVRWISKIHYIVSSLFLGVGVIITRSSLLAGIWWSAFVLKFQRIYTSHSLGQILVGTI